MQLRINWIDAKELTPPINGNFVVITRNSYMSWAWCDAFAMEIANWYDYDNAVYSGSSQRQVYRLVLLKRHVYVAEPAPDE